MVNKDEYIFSLLLLITCMNKGFHNTAFNSIVVPKSIIKIVTVPDML